MDRYVECISLISVMLLSTALAGCPSRCICSRDAVRCVEKFLLEVPTFETLENNPVVIDLSSNDIEYIEHFSLSFDKAEIVQILYLNNSKIIDIDDTAFKELINIRELYLSKNILSDIPPNLFKYNENLVYLDLSYNLFRFMPKIKSSNLEILNMMNSGIEIVEHDRFMDLPNLRYMNLMRNNIRFIEIDTFKYLTKLVSIELDFNAWECNCETVEMFNVLKAKEVLTINELVQCKTINDVFINIFNESGALEPVKKLCSQNSYNKSYNFGGVFDKMEVINQKLPQKRNKKFEANNGRNKLDTRTSLIRKSKFNNTLCEHVEYSSTFTFPVYAVFFSCISLAFVVGLALGFLIFSSKKNNKTTDGSSCCDSLVRSV